MKIEKNLAILMTIALVLAGVAIILNISESDIPTERNFENINSKGVVGISIIPLGAENKLGKTTETTQS
jgi:hypothetical protein